MNFNEPVRVGLSFNYRTSTESPIVCLLGQPIPHPPHLIPVIPIHPMAPLQ